MERAEATLTSFKILRIAEDRHGAPFVEVLVEETGQQRRLYEGESLGLVVDLKALSREKEKEG